MWTWIANHPTLTIVLCITALGLMLYAMYLVDKEKVKRRKQVRFENPKVFGVMERPKPLSLMAEEKKKSRSNARLM